MRKREKIPCVTVVAGGFLFLAPNYDFVHALTAHDGQRLAQLAVLLLMLGCLLLPTARRGVTNICGGLPRAALCSLGLVLLLGLLSSAVAPLPRWAFLEWGLSVLLLLLALAVAAERCQFGKALDVGLTGLLFSMAAAYSVTALSIYCAMLLVTPAYGIGFDIRELYATFSNVRFFGHIQTMALPFLVLPALWWGGRHWQRVLLWSVPVIWWMLAIGSGTRGTWVALLVGAVAALAYGGSAGRRWLQGQVLAFGIGLLGYAVFMLGLPLLIDLPPTFLHRTGDILSLSRREDLWLAAVQQILANPLLGTGPMHYAYWSGEIAVHPHNAVLQWAAEWGLPAALLMTAVWAWGGLTFAAWVRNMALADDDRGRMFRSALLAALAGASAQAMVDGVLVMPVSQVLFAVLAGWALGSMRLASAAVTAGLAPRLSLAVIVLAAAVAVVQGVRPEIGRIAERQKAYQAVHGQDRILLPRFWALGNIRE
jgi:O-antigen ligase